MRTVVRRGVKLLIILLGFITLFWGIIVGLIATPEVITPHIVNAIQNYTKSEVSIKSVDLSLFTRFPNITLRIDSLRITQTKDSIDDLIFARECRIAVSPIAILSNRLAINHMSLRDASIYLYVDSLHGPIKTFILPESIDEEESVDTLKSTNIGDYTLSIRRLKIDSTRIVIDDRNRGFYTRIDDFGVDMSMNLTSSTSNIDVVTGFSNLIVWNQGDLLVKKTSMELRSKMLYNRDSMQLSFDKAGLKLNNIDLKARGLLRRDTIADGILVDVRSSLNTPSISEFLALIPASIIDEKDKITTEGEVVFDIEVKGLYSDTSYPEVEATLKIDNANAKYESRKIALERVDCDAYMFVDLNTPKNSYTDIKSLHINTSDIIDLTLSGKVTDAIENPAVDLIIESNFNFDRFSEVFPLNESVLCRGTNISNIKTQFTVSDLQNSNYADLYIDGESIFHNLEISVDASKFIQDSTSLAYIYMQAERGVMLFGDNVIAQTDSRTLRSKVNFLDLNYKSKSGEYITIKDIEIIAGANFDRATSAVNGIGIRGIAKNTDVGIDSLFSANLESSDISLIVKPQNEEHQTIITTTINSQQITANEPNYNSELELSTVDMNLTLEREAERQWGMDGRISFSDFGMFSDLFPIDVAIPETSITVSNKTIYLDNAHLTVGNSELVATGNIHNLIRKLFIDPRASLSGELAIKASMLNFSEIVEASNRSVLMLYLEDLESDVEAAEESEGDVVVDIVADSLALDSLNRDLMAESSMFMVPRRMDFAFDLNIDKAHFWDAEIENVEGRATINNGVLSLDKLTLNAIGAEAIGSVIYRNIDPYNSNIALNMSLAGVDINRIGELMPSVNSMFPMLDSFEGIVDFDVKANTNVDSDLQIDISTLFSAMRFKGKNLVLLDSDTFADLSKTLMFKNKDRNLIDSIEVYALAAESTVDVLPFSMSMDRYTAIIGGSQVIDPQTFDVDYSYQISIIKSPLPFKAGVDVTGDLEDFKFKITKAKLKKTDFDEQRNIYEEYSSSIDASEAELVEELEAKRQEMQAKRREQREAQEQLEQLIEEELESEEEHMEESEDDSEQ